MLGRQDKSEKAEEIFRQALNGSEVVLDKKDFITLCTLHHLGVVLCDQSKYKAAEKGLRQALSAGEREYTRKEHPDTLTSVSNLASILDGQANKKQPINYLDKR